MMMMMMTMMIFSGQRFSGSTVVTATETREVAHEAMN
jgi:hypothetical protein